MKVSQIVKKEEEGKCIKVKQIATIEIIAPQMVKDFINATFKVKEFL